MKLTYYLKLNRSFGKNILECNSKIDHTDPGNPAPFFHKMIKKIEL